MFFLWIQFFMLGIECCSQYWGIRRATLPPTCLVVSGKDLDVLCLSFLICKMRMMSSLRVFEKSNEPNSPENSLNKRYIV